MPPESKQILCLLIFGPILAFGIAYGSERYNESRWSEQDLVYIQKMRQEYAYGDIPDGTLLVRRDGSIFMVPHGPYHRYIVLVAPGQTRRMAYLFGGGGQDDNMYNILRLIRPGELDYNEYAAKFLQQTLD